MNLLVVSSLMQGATAVYLVEALKELGCAVRVVSDIAHPLADHLEYGILDLPRWLAASGQSSDAVLFVEGGTRRLFPAGMERIDCLTAWWAIDSHVHLDLHLATARLFDLTFVVQREFLERFTGSNAHWLPLAADPRLFGGSEARDLDVAYVGSDNRAAYPERARLLDVMRARYPNAYLGRASPEDMGRIYGRAKIVFNKSVRNDVNMRYFEGMCAGAALVTDKLHDNGVGELFEPGSLVEYEDEASLIRTIDRLLADEATRKEIGGRARALVLERHTFAHRARTLLDTLSAARHSVRPAAHHYMPVYHLLRFPDGVLDAATRSLSTIRRHGDRNPVLGMVAALAELLSGVLLGAYRMRYRLRHWRLGRRSKAP
jgi:glycosyltransferase involved in cell wall biosynthesis